MVSASYYATVTLTVGSSI